MRGLSSCTEDEEALISENCRGPCHLGNRVVTTFVDEEQQEDNEALCIDHSFKGGIDDIVDDVKKMNNFVEGLEKLSDDTIREVKGVINVPSPDNNDDDQQSVGHCDDNVHTHVKSMTGYDHENNFVEITEIPDNSVHETPIEHEYKSAATGIEVHAEESVDSNPVSDTPENMSSHEIVMKTTPEDDVIIETTELLNQSSDIFDTNAETNTCVEHTNDLEKNVVEILQESNDISDNTSIASDNTKIGESESREIDEEICTTENNGVLTKDEDEIEEDLTSKDIVEEPPPSSFVLPVCITGLALAIPLAIYLATKK